MDCDGFKVSNNLKAKEPGVLPTWRVYYENNSKMQLIVPKAGSNWFLSEGKHLT